MYDSFHGMRYASNIVDEIQYRRESLPYGECMMALIQVLFFDHIYPQIK